MKTKPYAAAVRLAAFLFLFCLIRTETVRAASFIPLQEEPSGTDFAEAVFTAETDPDESPGVVILRFVIVDAASGTDMIQGQAQRKGAVITICRVNGQAVTDKDGTSVPDGGEILRLKTDGNGTAAIRKGDLPQGIYCAKQTAAPRGCLQNMDWQAVFQIGPDAAQVILPADSAASAGLGGDLLQIPQQVKRADLRFTRRTPEGANAAGIPFRITRLDADGNPVETVSVQTDENGTIDTGALPVCFGAAENTGEPRGALVFAQYRIEELACSANRGWEMIDTLLFADEKGRPLELGEAFEDGVTYGLPKTGTG